MNLAEAPMRRHSFVTVSERGAARSGIEVEALVIADWKGSDPDTVEAGIEGLVWFGTTRPKTVPIFHRDATVNLTQTPRFQVAGCAERHRVFGSLRDMTASPGAYAFHKT